MSPRARFILALLLSVWAARSGAVPAPPMPAAEFIARYATPLDEDQVFYRWQSTTSGENLAKMGTMTPAMDKYFMDMTSNVMSGPGLYVAGSPLSSSEYLPRTGGNLLEVRIKKGTRVLNLMDADVIGAMMRHKLFRGDFEHFNGDDRPLMLRYQKDWFVAKNMAHQADFAMYPGPHHSLAELSRTLDAADPHPAIQLGWQIQMQRPGAIGEIVREHGLGPGLVRVLPHEQIKPLLEQTFSAPLAPERAERALKMLAESPRIRSLVTSDKGLNARAAEALGNVATPSLSPDEIKILAQVNAHAEDAGLARASRWVNEILNDPRFREDWGGLAERLVPILERTRLNDGDRKLVTERLGRLVESAAVGAPIERLQQIAHAAGVDDPSLGHSLDKLRARARALDRARQTGAPAAVQSALLEHSRVSDLVYAYDHIVAVNPQSRVNAAVEGLLKDEPGVIAARIHGPADLAAAARLAQRVPNAFPAAYGAALGADEAGRLRFLTACLDEPVCAHHLGEAVAKDRGAILNGIKDLAPLGERVRLTKADPAFVERLILAVRDPEQLASFGRGLTSGAADATHAKMLARAARELAPPKPTLGSRCLSGLARVLGPR